MRKKAHVIPFMSYENQFATFETEPRDSIQPSNKQIWDHVDQGIKALEYGTSHVRIIADQHNQAALEFLDVDKMEDVLDWVLVFLKEIKEKGERSCFISHGWADKCTKINYEDVHLYPFVFQSSYFKDPIYLKFAIRKSATTNEPNIYCHLNLHQAD